jgi:hypothetical protein
MADPNLMDVLREEKRVLKAEINRTAAELQLATTNHTQALTAYENWKARIINALPLTTATVPEPPGGAGV